MAKHCHAVLMEYDTVIIGATAAGLGAAFAKKGKTLMIDKHPHVACEYVQSFYYGTNWNAHPLTPEAAHLRDELFARGILSDDGRVHLPAVLPMLYHQLKESGIDLLLMTNVTNIERTAEGYALELFCVKGYLRILARTVIDTANCPFLYESAPQNIRVKSLNAILYGGKQPPVWEGEAARIVPGKLEGEYVLRFFVSPDETISGARKKLHQLWKSRPAALLDWTIAATADYFAYQADVLDRETSPNYIDLNPRGYDNVLDAFDAGARCARKEAL